MNITERQDPQPNPSRSPGYSANEDSDWLAGGQARERSDMISGYWTYVASSAFAVVMLGLCAMGAMP